MPSKTKQLCLKRLSINSLTLRNHYDQNGRIQTNFLGTLVQQIGKQIMFFMNNTLNLARTLGSFKIVNINERIQTVLFFMTPLKSHL